MFVTGQQEVNSLCAKLKRTFPSQSQTSTKSESEAPEANGVTATGSRKKKRRRKKEEKTVQALPRLNLDDFAVIPSQNDLELHDPDLDPQDDEEDDANVLLSDGDDDLEDGVKVMNESCEPLHVLPLYSLLSSERQNKVFQAPPVGHRLCVIATNVAETSITIPHIKYVVDTGRTKTKFYDKVTGVSTFKVTWTSKASANQRAGRAGRTSAGHCYRLYSSAVFNDELEAFSSAEIVRRPVDDLILQMKTIGIDKVINFPFPTPPSSEAVMAAEHLLISLGAIEPLVARTPQERKKLFGSGKITPLGKLMTQFPVAPRYSKMLSLANQHELLAYVVALVSALSVQQMFVDVGDIEDENEAKQTRHTKSRAARLKWTGVVRRASQHLYTPPH